jgi:N-acetylneuraminic acid mutarotase/uncharacterized protein YjdB
VAEARIARGNFLGRKNDVLADACWTKCRAVALYFGDVNMSRLVHRPAQIRVALLAAFLSMLAACGGGGSAAPSTPVAPSAPTYTAKSGVAQKGPLILGSTVTAQELAASLSPTGKQYSYQVISNLGTFLPTSTFGSPYIGVLATGYYFDEVANTVSSGTVTLNGYGDLAIDQVLNVNLLTTLAYQRIQNLVSKSNLTFAAARSQAEGEVLSALNIPSGNYGNFGSLDLSGDTDGDHILAAISSLFVYGNSSGPLSQLIANFQSDIGANGVITNEATTAALVAAAEALNPATIAANLTQYYASEGLTFTAANISEWIAQSGDGVIGKFVFQVSDATPSTIFTLPAFVISQFAGTTISLSAGQLTINGTTATAPISFKAGDMVTVTPGSGYFPNGVLTCYLVSGSTNLVKVSFVSGLLSIAVTPGSPSIAMGQTQQFTATGTYSDTSTAILSNTVMWTSNTPTVATINATTGLASALLAGSITVTATLGSVSAGATLTVTQPAAGTWVPTGSMSNPRVSHTATLLQGGNVLVAAGNVSGDALTSAELYNPASGMWSTTGSLVNARSTGFTATLLPNGMVLVVGGFAGGTQTLSSAELYNPATGTWSTTSSLPNKLCNHTATLLPNGQVLVAGGSLDFNIPSITSAAYLYDPATAMWTQTGSLATPRSGHSAVLLQSGQVLAAGGESTGTAELYDPAAGTWSSAGNLSSPSAGGQTATLLANGQVLIAGGAVPNSGTGYLSAAELYDPVANSWSVTGSALVARSLHTATLLTNGTVLVAGGDTESGGVTADNVATAELYDPVAGTWSSTGSLTTGRSYHSATLLPNGVVMVAGGQGIAPLSAGTLASAELYY